MSGASVVQTPSGGHSLDMNAATPRFVGCSNLHRKAGHVGHGNKSAALHCSGQFPSENLLGKKERFQIKVAEELVALYAHYAFPNN